MAGAPTITGRAAVTAHLPGSVVVAVVALRLATAALATAGTASADPTPPPGYQIPDPSRYHPKSLQPQTDHRAPAPSAVRRMP